jgi:hypothetical protein
MMDDEYDASRCDVCDLPDPTGGRGDGVVTCGCCICSSCGMSECTCDDDDDKWSNRDLSTMPLDQLLADNNSVLDNAVRQVREQLKRPGETYAAHGTTPSPLDSRHVDERRVT